MFDILLFSAVKVAQNLFFNQSNCFLFFIRPEKSTISLRIKSGD